MSLREKAAEAEWMSRRRAVGRRAVGLMVAVVEERGLETARPGGSDHGSQV